MYPGLLPMLKAAHSLPILAHREGSPVVPIRAAKHIGVPCRSKIAWIRQHKLGGK
jgi:hypothetical protein